MKFTHLALENHYPKEIWKKSYKMLHPIV